MSYEQSFYFLIPKCTTGLKYYFFILTIFLGSSQFSQMIRKIESRALEESKFNSLFTTDFLNLPLCMMHHNIFIIMQYIVVHGRSYEQNFKILIN